MSNPRMGLKLNPIVYMKSKQTRRPIVAVIGAGFGGLSVVRALRNVPVEIRLIDQNNYHTFQPLLYQVATAGLEPESIGRSIRSMLQRQKNADFVLGKVVAVNRADKKITLETGLTCSYDYLVLAAGATNNFFGIPGVAEHAFTLKTMQDAMVLRSHVLSVFEKANLYAERRDDGLLHFVVVGGGPTGVEMAGALVELFEMVLKKDFPHLPIHRAKVSLIEATSHLLSAFGERYRNYTVAELERRGVQVYQETKVVSASAKDVLLHTGERLPTATLIWAAGVRVNPLADLIGVKQGAAGRIEVLPDLRLPDDPSVFVIGDMAASTDENGNLHPQLAPNAIQAGKHVALQLKALINQLPTQPYRYFDKGIMATIGRNAAVAETPWGLRAKGFGAWLAWLFVHLMYLVGFRNRLLVFFDWLWNYVSYDRSARMIFPDPFRSRPASSGTVSISDEKQTSATLEQEWVR